MSLSATSLNAVTSPGAGSAMSFDKPRGPISMQVSTTGSPSGLTVYLEGSLDGVNYNTIATVTGTGSSQEFVSATGPVLFARANLQTLSGGVSPTCTAVIAVAD